MNQRVTELLCIWHSHVTHWTLIIEIAQSIWPQFSLNHSIWCILKLINTLNRSFYCEIFIRHFIQGFSSISNVSIPECTLHCTAQHSTAHIQRQCIKSVNREHGVNVADIFNIFQVPSKPNQINTKQKQKKEQKHSISVLHLISLYL